MRWELSDGTVVESDGARLTVSGEGVAVNLRAQLEDIERITARDELPPSRSPLDPAIARTIDAWIVEQLEVWTPETRVVSRPTLEPPPPPEPEYEPEPGEPDRVY